VWHQGRRDRRAGSGNLPSFARGATIEIAFPGISCDAGNMNKLCIFVGTTAGGIIGGLICPPSLGFVTQFVVSGIGSVVGVYVGWKVAQRIDR